MSQILDLGNTETIKFNDNPVETLQLNGVEIWAGFNKLEQLIDRSIESVMAEDLEGITTIGNHAFSYCKNLKDVIIPNSVTSIKSNAFLGCSGLKNIIIGSGVTDIKDFAFDQCTSLTTMKLLPTTPPTIGEVPSSVTRIEVPINSLSDYQSAEVWNDSADKMGGV